MSEEKIIIIAFTVIMSAINASIIQNIPTYITYFLGFVAFYLIVDIFHNIHDIKDMLKKDKEE